MEHKIITPSFKRTDERGTFLEVLNTGHWESLICGQMNKGAVIGNHYHKKTLVFFFLTKGAVKINIINVESSRRHQVELGENQGVILKTNESHAIHFLKESEFVMLKSIRYTPEDPDTFPFVVEE
ncbi:WxcM-like domain-containing protein [bacterium]|nr:WxcM-like domain-containing protein [bacterium]